MILFLCVYHQIYPLKLIVIATLLHKITKEGFCIRIKKKKKKKKPLGIRYYIINDVHINDFIPSKKISK